MAEEASDSLPPEGTMADETERKILNIDLITADDFRVRYSDNTEVVYTVEQLATLPPKDSEKPDPE